VSEAISLKHVSKSFRVGKNTVQALNDLNLAVEKGIVTALVGPDGAGKTTLMRLVMGLLLPDTGEITVFGHSVQREAATVQEMTGYMPQRFGLYEDLTVQENMELYAELKGLSRQGRRERYDLLFRMSGLAPFTSRMAGRLSGGMKQKLGLICTLLSSPQLLILDEPTVGVDPLSRRELWQIIRNAVENEGMTVLLSTAYLDEAERCEQVILLNRGRIVGQGRPSSFLEPLKGRTFFVTSQKGLRRDLALELSALPSVVDVALQADGVRVIAKKGGLEPLCGVNVTAIAPRFEDAFVTLLTQAQEAPSLTGQHSAPKASPCENAPSLTKPLAAGSATNEDVIVVKDLEKWFGAFCAVNKVSFTVKRGEIFGLLGANGAGKSTTFRMLCGLLPATRGVLQVSGENLLRASSRARMKIGYMAQRFSLYGNLTVLQNLHFFAGAYGLKDKRREERIQWALTEFGLTPFQDFTAMALSLGHKQRLALAAALMHEPDILFLDEPTSGVDPLARREFWREIHRLAQRGVTVLVTTHFMEEAEYCDRLLIMSRGEVLVQGAPQELKAQYGMASIEELFVSLLERREERL
jgi:ABC-2 type transport system ATP-binding protein